MHFEERHSAILDFLDAKGNISVSEMVAYFGVSEMTIRRDLDALEKKGLLRRVHGGAVSARGRSYEPPFFVRNSDRQIEKKRIGQFAASMVKDGDSIALDVGTTTLEVARHLIGKQNITIITPSLHIAGILAEQSGIRLILTGGILRRGELSMVGSLAERVFHDFYVDKLFLGIGGIDFDAGLTEFNLEDASVKKAMLKSAKEVILVADSVKFGQVAFAAVGPLKVVKRIVTDSSLSPDVKSRLEAQGIEVFQT